LNFVSYEPGVCNIGPAEISRRMRAGHAGVIASVVLFVLLVAVGAPHLVRLVVALPTAVAASGYIQARLHFCAAFGSRGVFNFGALGSVETVADQEAQARDRRRSMQIGLTSAAVGLAVGIVAALLPIA